MPHPTPPPTPEDLTFGIELECIMPRANLNEQGRNALADHITLGGIICRQEQYNHSRRNHWKIVTDASLGYDNAEVVSPILRHPQGYEDLARVCKLMTEFGCRVSQACGSHVHIGVRDLPQSQDVGFFKALLKTHAKFQPVLDQLVSPSRRGRRQYIVPLEYTPAMDSAETLDRLARLAQAGHFSNPNFWDAFQRHGTVEFRQHQGSLNGEKLTHWVKLCQRIVAHAAAATTQTPTAIYRPAPPPPYPPRPHPPTTPYDLTLATPLTRAQIPRFARTNSYDLRDMILVRVAQPNPHRPGTEAHTCLESCRHPGLTLRELMNRGVSRSWLGYFADRGEVTIVRRSAAPTTPLTPTQQSENEAIQREWREECDRITAAYEQAEAARRAAFEQQHPPPTQTPNTTDAAPVTLDGLLELVNVPEPERAFFIERQLELNPAT